MNTTDTPRTDAERESHPSGNCVSINFARQLEKELNCWIYNANELQKAFNKLEVGNKQLTSRLESSERASKKVADALQLFLGNGDIEKEIKEARQALYDFNLIKSSTSGQSYIPREVGQTMPPVSLSIGKWC